MELAACHEGVSFVVGLAAGCLITVGLLGFLIAGLMFVATTSARRWLRGL